MVTNNPYAPPRHDEQDLLLPRGGVGMMGDVLICDKGVSLPPLCLFSGEPASSRTSRLLAWAPQWWGLVAVMSPLIGLLLYFVVRKTGKLEYSLSPAASQRARNARWLAIGGVVVGFVLAGVAAAAKQPELAVLFLVAAFIAIVVGTARSRLFRITKIDKLQIHLKLRPAAAEAFARHFATAR